MGWMDLFAQPSYQLGQNIKKKKPKVHLLNSKIKNILVIEVAILHYSLGQQIRNTALLHFLKTNNTKIIEI